jgi:hypothetical protein
MTYEEAHRLAEEQNRMAINRFATPEPAWPETEERRRARNERLRQIAGAPLDLEAAVVPSYTLSRVTYVAYEGDAVPRVVSGVDPVRGEEFVSYDLPWPCNCPFCTAGRGKDSPERDKSLALLKSWLSPDQLREFENRNSFCVRGSSTGDIYAIEADWTYNVVRLRDDQRICFQPDDALPLYDVMLVQKIALECDEEKALAVANFRSHEASLFDRRDIATALNRARSFIIEREMQQQMPVSQHVTALTPEVLDRVAVALGVRRAEPRDR